MVTVLTVVVVPVTERLPETVKFCEAVTLPLASMVIESTSLEEPIVEPSPITRELAIVNRPAELKDIFSVAVSLTPTLNDNLVALLVALKSPSDTASIAAAINLESVPVPSSGA